MEDSIHHKQLRLQLISNLKNKGILDPHVLEALNRVPRHLFTGDLITAHEAYEDKMLENGLQLVIAQPYVVAYQAALLNIKSGDKVLEIGTGSGYQSTVLFELGADLYTVEQNHDSYLKAKQRLMELGYSQINVFYEDENDGLNSFAPYDKIIVNNSGPGITAVLMDQLKIGGMLIMPVPGDYQKIMRVLKLSDSEIRSDIFEEFFALPVTKR